MTPLRLFVNAIVGGFLLFAWANLAPAFFGDPPGAIGLEHEVQAGDPYSFGRTLVAYLADCTSALAAGWFLWLAAPRVRSMRWRVVFVASLGLFAGLVADLPLWNHGGFPGLWLLRQMAEIVIGFTLVGLFLSWRMKTYRFVPQKPAPTR